MAVKLITEKEVLAHTKYRSFIGFLTLQGNRLRFNEKAVRDLNLKEGQLIGLSLEEKNDEHLIHVNTNLVKNNQARFKLTIHKPGRLEFRSAGLSNFICKTLGINKGTHGNYRAVYFYSDDQKSVFKYNNLKPSAYEHFLLKKQNSLDNEKVDLKDYDSKRFLNSLYAKEKGYYNYIQECQHDFSYYRDGYLFIDKRGYVIVSASDINLAQFPVKLYQFYKIGKEAEND